MQFLFVKCFVFIKFLFETSISDHTYSHPMYSFSFSTTSAASCKSTCNLHVFLFGLLMALWPLSLARTINMYMMWTYALEHMGFTSGQNSEDNISPSCSIYWLSVAPQEGIGSHEHLPHPWLNVYMTECEKSADNFDCWGHDYNVFILSNRWHFWALLAIFWLFYFPSPSLGCFLKVVANIDGNFRAEHSTITYSQQ